jgi:hypothetical protein
MQSGGENGIGYGVEGMAAKTPGWRRGSSPEAAKRCPSLRRALRATTVPVKMDGGCELLNSRCGHRILLGRTIVHGQGCTYHSRHCRIDDPAALMWTLRMLAKT